jgi:thiol-disulfide isomerase/thioredoxin
MKLKNLLLTAFMFLSMYSFSQNNFTYTPEKPKPGDLITFTYEPGGDISTATAPIEAVAFMNREGQSVKAFDITTKKEGKKYTGTVQTDASGNFLYFNFSSDKKFDNNNNNGYLIQLWDGEKPAKGALGSEGQYHQYNARSIGDLNPAKAMESYEKEFQLYPQSKVEYMPMYARLIATEKKDQSQALLLKEIETVLKDSLKDEYAYTTLETLYASAKLPQQAKMIASLKKEKYPNGKWTISDLYNRFFGTADIDKKLAIRTQLFEKIMGNKQYEYMVDPVNNGIITAYGTAKKWDLFKQSVTDAGLTNSPKLTVAYNNIAWDLQEDSSDLQMAEELSKFAAETSKKEWKSPTVPKPEFLTTQQWNERRKGSYGMNADTYATVLYRLGKYKAALPYAKDAAFLIANGQSTDENLTYARIAERALPTKTYRPQLEKFVREGKANAELKQILARAYAKDKKSSAGFDEYYAALEQDSFKHMLEELKKSMLNETAPTFALYNLDGAKVDLTELKGKVVVVDFWATWCGPCKASFPAMQQAVTKYKADPNVKFVFIDTWEQAGDKKKNAADFIQKNKYSFDVLMDLDDKVISQFKVDGIPTKYVIDKEGKIRFKAVGFDGNDDKLVKELTAMIEMAGNPEKKAF